MKVKDLIEVLENCDAEDEISFIFDSDKRLSVNRRHGLFEVSNISVTGRKINGKIALTNGLSSLLVEDDAEPIFDFDKR